MSLNDDQPLWKLIASGKKASRDGKIPPDWQLKPGQVPDDQLNVINVPRECGILTPKEQQITELNAKGLVEKLLIRDFSSYEVGL